MKSINRIIYLFVLFTTVLHKAAGQEHQLSKVWVADQGNGTYRNPILFADYSDPDAIRVNNDYYMVASSFNCMPGLPILHSYDLVNWKVINYAINSLEPKQIYDIPQQGKGVWAPCIRYHNHQFYIYYPDPDYGIFMIKASNPAKAWSRPELVLKGSGIIDPAPFWDSDGKAYLATAWAASRAGVNSLITLWRMNADGTKVMDKGRHIYDGHDKNPTVEGPKLYKLHGYYYIFAPAGGVTTGWQLVLRSRNIYGPYEAKIVMDQGKTNINGPHQGAYVETQTGEPWFLHFQDRGAYGRVIHLEPVKWVGNWPVIGIDNDGDGKGEPVQRYKKPDVGKRYPMSTPAESDEFNGAELGLQWQWQANPKIQWSALLPGTNFIRLFAFPTDKDAKNLWPVPNLLLQKLPAPDFTATTKVKYTVEWDSGEGKKAGLVIMGNDYAYLAISKNKDGYELTQAVCTNAIGGEREQVVSIRKLSGDVVYLRLHVEGDSASCHFSFSEDGKVFQPIGNEFTAKPVKWTGAKMGIFCTASPDTRTGGYADFDWFRVGK